MTYNLNFHKFSVDVQMSPVIES